jgi:hypothetical protein
MGVQHRRVTRAVLFTGTFLVGVAWPLAAQTIRGRVLEEFTDRPIGGAAVSLLTEQGARVAQGATSASDGGFTLPAPSPSTYRLWAEKPGYRLLVSPALQLRQGDVLDVTLRLLPDTIVLRPVVVTASNRRPAGRFGGFYDRMGRHVAGTFITRDQIERRHPIQVSDLLRTIPGLEVLPSPRGFGFDVRTVDGCRPQVFLDGVPYALLGGETIDDVVSPTQLEGIEVYRHAAEVPAEFLTAGSSCGAIVLWTRI